METTSDPELQKDVICAYLVKAHEKWSPLYKRVLRAAGLDANLNAEFKPHQTKMDGMLEELIEVPGVRVPE